MKYFNLLIQSQKTVFDYNDIVLLTAIHNTNTVKAFLLRAQKAQLLQCIHKGLRALSHYNPYEVAVKLKSQSYISLETVLYTSGIIFQYYHTTVTYVSSDTRTMTYDGYRYEGFTIKESIRTNPLGLRHHPGYMIATPERAFADMVYLTKQTYVDNPQWLNLTQLELLLPMYPKTIQSLLTMFISDVRSNHA